MEIKMNFTHLQLNKKKLISPIKTSLNLQVTISSKNYDE